MASSRRVSRAPSPVGMSPSDAPASRRRRASRFGLAGRHHDLEAVLPGVSHAGDGPGDAGDPPLGEPVVADRREVEVGERLEDRRGARPLEREQRGLVAEVLDRLRGGAAPLPDPGEVLRRVRGVRDQQEGLCPAPINDDVVHEAAGVGGERRVLRPPRHQPGHVVRGQRLQQRQRPRPADPQLAHVTHVEESGRLPHREVLGDHSRKLHRHLPAGERNEPAAEFLVEAVERGAAEGHPGDYRNRWALRSVCLSRHRFGLAQCNRVNSDPPITAR